MKLTDAAQELQELFPDAITITNPEVIDQNGQYLYFEGLSPHENPDNRIEDTGRFVLICAGNSWDGKGDGVLGMVEEARKVLYQKSLDETVNMFRGVKAAVLGGSGLYLYAVLIQIKIEVE